ncbi:MAG: AbrB/MazE/SpoVT family DNA-binding domain-containing protein [Bacillota bacterium]
MALAKISANWQINIPLEIRKLLKLRPGQFLQMQQIGNEIRLVPVQENISKLRGALVNVAGSIPENYDAAVEQGWKDWANDYAKKA